VTGLPRRSFLKSAATAAGALTLGGFVAPVPRAAAAETLAATPADLPRGPAPKPLATPYFPSRLHAFVWRNWPLVLPDRMARVVAARPEQILRIGRAMGLGTPPRIPPDQQIRSAITVIRRNWHLLPYEQLLDLLGWTADQMAFALREDDFLYVKLGNLKPDSAPLRYEEPDVAMLEREREIAQILQSEFPPAEGAGDEGLFSFVAELSRQPAGAAKPPGLATDSLRYCYSYFALYGDPLLEPDADPYPEGLLARLAETGVNGVWLQAVLHKLAPCPWQPERSARWQERLDQLGRLAVRTRRHGIGVYLYLNEPRALAQSFFASHPGLKGVSEGDHAALCTSVPEVQDYLRNSVAAIARAVPELGGFFTITASENLTNCWSHQQGAHCPRCAARPPAEVIAGVNRIFQEGVKAAKTNARLIVWDWGWDDAWAPDAIQRLPAGVDFQSVSEWSLPLERGGVKTTVGEYSLSAVGPGPRARKHWRIAREHGLRTVAKIQAGCTWELSPVPAIPAVESAARHAENLYREGVRDLMLGWTLGGYPSANLEAVAEVMACGSAETALRRVAERRFGVALAPAILAAWHGFSAAFAEFPYDGPVLYLAPLQMGPANLLHARPTGYSATMVGLPYDDLDAWHGAYPAAVFAGQLEKVADGFDQTLATLAATPASPAGDAERLAFNRERGVAEACALHFRSAAHQTRFILARRAAAATGGEAAAAHRAEMARLLRGEIALAKRLHHLQSRDSRLGFEASNQYFYVPVDLMEKVINCHHLLARL